MAYIKVDYARRRIRSIEGSFGDSQEDGAACQEPYGSKVIVCWIWRPCEALRARWSEVNSQVSVVVLSFGRTDRGDIE